MYNLFNNPFNESAEGICSRLNTTDFSAKFWSRWSFRSHKDVYQIWYSRLYKVTLCVLFMLIQVSWIRSGWVLGSSTATRPCGSSDSPGALLHRPSSSVTVRGLDTLPASVHTQPPPQVSSVWLGYNSVSFYDRFRGMFWDYHEKAFQHALTHTHLMYNNAFTVETYGAVCYTNVIINKHLWKHNYKI